MSCGIHTGCKMSIYVHQCMRNSFNINNEIFIRRRFNTLKKALKPVSLVKLSHHSIEGVTVHYGQGWSRVLLKKRQFVVPVACNLYSNDSCQIKPVDERKEEKKEKVGIYKKFKTMFKEYWYVLIPVHLVTSCFWFGGFYYMAASGVDIPVLLETLGAPESWIEKFKNTKAGNVVLAYTMYKVVTPIRYTVTVGGTTLSIKHLKNWGWIKPVPSSQEIKKMYQGQKEALRDLTSNCQDKMQVTKTEFLKTKQEMIKQFEVAKEGFHKTMSDMRHDFKEGVKEGTDEWKMISKSFAREVKEGVENLKKKGN